MRFHRRGRTAQLKGVAADLQSGGIRLYAGQRPATEDDVPGVESQVLAELTVSAIEFSEGWMRFPMRGTGRVLGNVKWFQALSADGEVLFDGTAGRTEGDLIAPIDLVQPGAPISLVGAFAVRE